MKPAVHIGSARDELFAALEEGRLAGPVRLRGEDLLEMLDRPPRLTLLGLPGAGKSRLLNLLLGSDVLPHGAALPTVSLSYGAQACAAVTLADGTCEVLEHANFAQIAAMPCVFIEAQLPLPALAKLSMMEVVAPEDQAQQQRALRWSASRTDIALWCTRSFEPRERDIWAAAPEAIQDHGFMIVTHADLLGAQGTLVRAVEGLRDRAGEAFAAVLPIATPDGIAARHRDGRVDKDAMRASGATMVISAILKQVETGRQATEDAIGIFLRQIEFDPAPRTPPEPVPQTVPEQEPEPEPQPVSVADQAPLAPEPQLGEDARDLCAQGLVQLQRQAAEWAVRLESDPPGEDEIVDGVTEAMLWLSESLGDLRDVAVGPLADLAFDAADMCQLIQMETGEARVLDALTVMVQLKEELGLALHLADAQPRQI